jgi:hypothetical protein
MNTQEVNMKSKITTLLTLTFLLMTAVSTSFIGYSTYKRQRVEYLKGSNIVYVDGSVLGINSDEVAATVDFNAQTQTGSPLVFGGAHSPKLEHPKAWDEIAEAGFTVVRSDFYLDRFLPQKMTLEQYKQNYMNYQNPSSWNQSEIKKVQAVFVEARKRNMKTMGILAYGINWLSHSKTHYGVPKDWDVYEDLSRKTYSLFRNDVDYLEIWNEPDMPNFLDVKNSGVTQPEAYYEIVKHAVKGVREVDAASKDGKRMKIGVGVMSRPTNPQYLEKILQDKDLMNEIDFVSYHNYEHSPEPSYTPIVQILKKHNFANMPIFLTEWAHTPNLKQSDPYVLTEQAIPYTGAKLISLMNMGITGANYFTLQPIAPDSKRGDEGLLGIYNSSGTSVSMLPVIKTWDLMSSTLRLGKGTSRIFKTTASDEHVLAFENYENTHGLVLSNESSETKQFNISMKNVPISGDIRLDAYVASKDQDGKQVLGTVVIKGTASGANFSAVVPANAVLGVTMAKPTLRDRLPL